MKRSRGALCRDMQACHTYFCGTKLPIAAEMDGAKFVTSQWVYVAFYKWNNKIVQTNQGLNTEDIKNSLKYF